jgi:hypothetical protein
MKRRRYKIGKYHSTCRGASFTLGSVMGPSVEEPAAEATLTAGPSGIAGTAPDRRQRILKAANLVLCRPPEPGRSPLVWLRPSPPFFSHVPCIFGHRFALNQRLTIQAPPASPFGLPRTRSGPTSYVIILPGCAASAMGCNPDRRFPTWQNIPVRSTRMTEG